MHHEVMMHEAQCDAHHGGRVLKDDVTVLSGLSARLKSDPLLLVRERQYIETYVTKNAATMTEYWVEVISRSSPSPPTRAFCAVDSEAGGDVSYLIQRDSWYRHIFQALSGREALPPMPRHTPADLEAKHSRQCLYDPCS